MWGQEVESDSEVLRSPHQTCVDGGLKGPAFAHGRDAGDVIAEAAEARDGAVPAFDCAGASARTISILLRTDESAQHFAVVGASAASEVDAEAVVDAVGAEEGARGAKFRRFASVLQIVLGRQKRERWLRRVAHVRDTVELGRHRRPRR